MFDSFTVLRVYYRVIDIVTYYQSVIRQIVKQFYKTNFNLVERDNYPFGQRLILEISLGSTPSSKRS